MTKEELTEKFLDTLGNYFDCGYTEGRYHLDYDDEYKATILLSKLHSLFNQALEYQGDTQSVSN